MYLKEGVGLAVVFLSCTELSFRKQQGVMLSFLFIILRFPFNVHV